MRILIHPRPNMSYSVGLVLNRISVELQKRHFSCSSTFFHYFGCAPFGWDYGFVMGAPRFLDRIIKSGKPIILTMGLPEHSDMYKALGMEYRREHLFQENRLLDAVLSVHKIVFISQFAKRKWKEIFLKRKIEFPGAEKTAVIYHPVDTTHFRPAAVNGDGPFILGAAGVFRRRGRISTVFRISRRLGFDHRILLVGEMSGEGKEEFAKGMSDATIAARTVHVPWISSDKLPEYYKQMHCLIHAMHGESFCLTVAEALCCGVPVVVPQYGAPAEYLPPNGGAIIDGPRWLWPEEVIAKMAKAVCDIRENRVRFSATASKVRSLFAVENVVDQYLEMMELPMDGRVAESFQSNGDNDGRC